MGGRRASNVMGHHDHRNGNLIARSLQRSLDKGNVVDHEKLRERLGKVVNQGRRLERLINDLLDLSRITRTSLRNEPTNLTDLACGVLADLQNAEPSRSVAVEIADGLAARGDPRLLKIALVNLLGNAWKYTAKRSDAQIEFGRETKGHETIFCVRDNGAGFDMAYAEKLFAPFQRLHQDSEFEGTGIGLATVQRIVSRHGGRIWAEAAIGKGATFFFTLGGAR